MDPRFGQYIRPPAWPLIERVELTDAALTNPIRPGLAGG
jgi:hypothetical protein